MAFCLADVHSSKIVYNMLKNLYFKFFTFQEMALDLCSLKILLRVKIAGSADTHTHTHTLTDYSNLTLHPRAARLIILKKQYSITKINNVLALDTHKQSMS